MNPLLAVQHPFDGVVIVAGIVVLILLVLVCVSSHKETPTTCPKCQSTNLHKDDMRYKGTVFHECVDCGNTFETLRHPHHF